MVTNGLLDCQRTKTIMENDKGTNITPLLEQIYGTSEINNAEDLQKLIDALMKDPDKKIDMAGLARIMESVKKTNKE